LLKEDGTWTINDAEAMEFDSLRSMIRTCLRLKVEDAKLLLRFDGSRTLNMRFQLPPRSAEKLAQALDLNRKAFSGK